MTLSNPNAISVMPVRGGAGLYGDGGIDGHPAEGQ
jgi:hypothetical protein